MFGSCCPGRLRQHSGSKDDRGSVVIFDSFDLQSIQIIFRSFSNSVPHYTSLLSWKNSSCRRVIALACPESAWGQGWHPSLEPSKSATPGWSSTVWSLHVETRHLTGTCGRPSRPACESGRRIESGRARVAVRASGEALVTKKTNESCSTLMYACQRAVWLANRSDHLRWFEMIFVNLCSMLCAKTFYLASMQTTCAGQQP
jgi:hypothetical protein